MPRRKADKENPENGKARNLKFTDQHAKQYSSLLTFIEESHPKEYNKALIDIKKRHPDYDDDAVFEELSLNYIDIFKRSLFDWIDAVRAPSPDDPTPDDGKRRWKDGTKEGYYFMIARWLEMYRPDDRYIQTYKTAGWNLKQAIENREGENQMDERELESLKPLEYYLAILKPDDEEYRTQMLENRDTEYQYLALAMLVLQPPLRTSFYTTAKITNVQKDEKKDKTNNWVVVGNRWGGRGYYQVNKDKVSNTKTYGMDKSLRHIEIDNKKLIKIIVQSLEKYPRTYLFESYRRSGEGDNEPKPITQSTYLNLLKRITGLKGVNVDNFRSAYVTWFHKNKKHTSGEKKDLANKMRHSLMTAMMNYNKIDQEEPEKNFQEEIDQLKQQITEKDVIIAKLETEIKQLKEEQLEKENPLYAKRRRDVVYNVNRKGRSPRAETIERYGLVQNDKTGVWE